MEKSRSFLSVSYSSYFGLEEEREKGHSYSFNGQRKEGSDPELKRKHRVTSYNVFTMEGKLKSSVRSSFRWIKSKFSDLR